MKKLLLITVITLMLPSIAHAKKINRNILAVLDSSEIKESYDDHIHQFAEMPLNHLGYKLDYIDATKPLPSDERMEKYHGIISWFTDNQIKNAEQYAKWLTRQLKDGKKLVMMEEPGFDFDEKGKATPRDVIEDFYTAFNTDYTPYGFTTSPFVIEVVKNDPAMTEFERPLGTEIKSFREIEARGNANVFLKLKRRDTKSICDAVFAHNKGGFVLSGYTVYHNPVNYQTRWRLNPFKFFSYAFGSDFPKPDVSTINGMRLMYSHIDGDGIRNLSEMDSKPCPDVLYDKILTQYKLPIAVSVVIGDILKTVGISRERLIAIIKKTFALPNVQTASHGWTHPFVWKKKGRKLAFNFKDFTYSPAAEIGGSIDYINEHLAPEGKKTRTFFWTGDCSPDYEALKYTYDNGILNLNGGDTRFDSEYPSYTYVAPLFRHVDGLLQFYTANSNENIYTRLWKGPFYGYRYVVDTFKNTESPIRIRPMDVYYHFYLVEKEIGYESLVDTYNWILGTEFTPVVTDHYIHVMQGFVSTEIEKLSDNRWVVTNNGKLNTVRFDDENRYVDLNQSKGVLGFLRYQSSLYVHLDNEERSEIVLTSTPPGKPYIAKANGMVSKWRTDGDDASFSLNTIGRVQFSVASLKKSHEYRVTANKTAYRVKSDDKGVLNFYIELPSRAYQDVEITME